MSASIWVANPGAQVTQAREPLLVQHGRQDSLGSLASWSAHAGTRKMVNYA